MELRQLEVAEERPIVCVEAGEGGQGVCADLRESQQIALICKVLGKDLLGEGVFEPNWTYVVRYVHILYQS